MSRLDEARAEGISLNELAKRELEIDGYKFSPETYTTKVTCDICGAYLPTHMRVPHVEFHKQIELLIMRTG